MERLKSAGSFQFEQNQFHVVCLTAALLYNASRSGLQLCSGSSRAVVAKWLSASLHTWSAVAARSGRQIKVK